MKRLIFLALLAGCVQVQPCPNQDLIIPHYGMRFGIPPVLLPEGHLNPDQTEHFWTREEFKGQYGIDPYEELEKQKQRREKDEQPDDLSNDLQSATP